MKKLLLAILTVAVSALPGCGSSNEEDGAGGDSARYTIAVVPKGLGHQFWLTVKAGADAAGAEFNAKIIWNGPAKETQIAKQIDIMHDMISRNVDAIVMAACDENALIDVIQSAVDEGIPVITIDSGVKSDLPVTFVATDNIKGAKLAADALAALIGGKGEVGILPIVPGAATSEMRESGFKEGIALHPGVKIVSTIYSMSDTAKALAAVEDMMTANPDLAGVFSASEPGAIGAIQAIETAGKAGEIYLVSFDASKEQIAALRRGSIQALVVQNPFRMGYEGVKAAIDFIEGRPVEERIDTGVTIVTLDNLDDPEIQKLLNPV
ncbi:MAG: ABC transporter substrate-binding protein [Candidatus Hydrogenedentes bacterium]|nr:ABC transporter substrate-binding protein [Candidatus Hydrogenedentota bacterium]